MRKANAVSKLIMVWVVSMVYLRVFNAKLPRTTRKRSQRQGLGFRGLWGVGFRGTDGAAASRRGNSPSPAMQVCLLSSLVCGSLAQWSDHWSSTTVQKGVSGVVAARKI